MIRLPLEQGAGRVEKVDPIETPVFLVGCMRSGTTLLSLMLSHHPDIAFPGEFDLCVDAIAEDGQLPDLADYYDWLHFSRHFHWHELEIDTSLAYSELVWSFLAKMKLEKDGGPKGQVGVAVHSKFEHLSALWPEARFIHLLRDPRDVSASIMAMGWAGNHFVGAESWCGAEASWDRLRSRIDPEKWIEVRFEDLLRGPESRLTEICDFIGVPYSAQMMEYPRHSTYSAVDSEPSQRWRKKQTPREIQLSEAAVGGLLEERGYEPSGHPRLEISGSRHRILKGLSRAANLRFRINRYGLGLWAERRISKALGLRRWYESVRFREHEITNRHLK